MIHLEGREASKALQADGEYISRQAVLETIDKWYEDKADIEDLIVKITYMPSVAIPSAEPKWIPVSKPPKKDGKYLVTIHYINITRDTIETVNYSKNLYKVNEYDFYDRKRAGWYNYDSEYGYYEVDSVIAWMPLPKPYEPQERSEE